MSSILTRGNYFFLFICSRNSDSGFLEWIFFGISRNEIYFFIKKDWQERKHNALPFIRGQATTFFVTKKRDVNEIVMKSFELILKRIEFSDWNIHSFVFLLLFIRGVCFIWNHCNESEAHKNFVSVKYFPSVFFITVHFLLTLWKNWTAVTDTMFLLHFLKPSHTWWFDFVLKDRLGCANIFLVCSPQLWFYVFYIGILQRRGFILRSHQFEIT